MSEMFIILSVVVAALHIDKKWSGITVICYLLFAAIFFIGGN